MSFRQELYESVPTGRSLSFNQKKDNCFREAIHVVY